VHTNYANKPSKCKLKEIELIQTRFYSFLLEKNCVCVTDAR